MDTSYQAGVEKKAELRLLKEKRRVLAEDRTSNRETVRVLAEKLDAAIRQLEEDIRNCAAQPSFAMLDRPTEYRGGRAMGTSDGPFRTMGEQCQAIARSARSGEVDRRLFDVRAAAGLGELVPSEGGFLLQQDFENQILANVFESGTVAARCRQIQLSGNAASIKIPGLDETSRVAGSRWGGVESKWIAEAGTIAPTKPKFRQIELNLKKQCVLVYVTDEMLQDSTVLENVLTRIASDELSFTLEEAIVAGSGAGEPLGIINADCLVSVDKESGQAAGTVLLENIVKMWSRLLGKSRANAVWLIN